ncbi:uncharacterized protein naf1 isoform 2-T2 [Synchiropus picturatus]
MDQTTEEVNEIQAEEMEEIAEPPQQEMVMENEEQAPVQETLGSNEAPPSLVCETAFDDSEDSVSDSSSSSSSSSSASPAHVLEADDNDDEGFSQPAPIKTKDEVLLEELPSVEEVNVILPDEAELRPAGTVSSVIQLLVVVQSHKEAPALTEDSIIFRSDRLALGKVFEVFGPVSSPLYIMRFNTAEQITNKGLIEGLVVYYAPDIKEYTGYILTQQLQLLKGSDASWKNDQEPPEEALDYSDDEKEQEARRKIKNSKKKTKDDNPAKKQQHPFYQGAEGYSRPAGPQFRPQHSSNSPSLYRHSVPQPRHPPHAPMYLPPPYMYHLPPPPTPNFHVYPPPPQSFFNPSFHHPFWPSNSGSPISGTHLPPPPPPPAE